MTKIRFEFSPNFAEIMREQEDVKVIEHEAALEALAIAQAIAPVRTGRYVDSLSVEGNVLQTDDPIGHLVEWGSVNNPAYAVLRQASEQVARIVEDPK